MSGLWCSKPKGEICCINQSSTGEKIEVSRVKSSMTKIVRRYVQTCVCIRSCHAGSASGYEPSFPSRVVSPCTDTIEVYIIVTGSARIRKSVASTIVFNRKSERLVVVVERTVDGPRKEFRCVKSGFSFQLIESGLLSYWCCFRPPMSSLLGRPLFCYLVLLLLRSRLIIFPWVPATSSTCFIPFVSRFLIH